MTRLTTRQISALKKQGRYLDGNGLHVLVGAGGAKSFVYRYMLRGKSHDVGLGPVEHVTLADARAEAHRLREIKRSGGDSLAVKRQERHQRQPSTAPLMRDFAEERIATWEKGWSNEKHKHWLRKAAERTNDAVSDAIGRITSAECANYFANAGYAPTSDSSRSSSAPQASARRETARRRREASRRSACCCAPARASGRYRSRPAAHQHSGRQDRSAGSACH